MIVSFDYDLTLSNSLFAQRLFIAMRQDPRVVFHIVTQRMAPPHQEAAEVLALAARLKVIRPENVHFTSRADKWPLLKALGAAVHVDDDHDQLALIHMNCPGCITISSV